MKQALISILLGLALIFGASLAYADDTPDSTKTINPSSWAAIKGSCPGYYLSKNFLGMYSDKMGTTDLLLKQEYAAGFIKNAAFPHEFKGKTFSYNFPQGIELHFFPVNGEKFDKFYTGSHDYVDVFGVQGECVIFYQRMPIVVANAILANIGVNDKIIPILSDSVDA